MTWTKTCSEHRNSKESGCSRCLHVIENYLTYRRKWYQLNKDKAKKYHESNKIERNAYQRAYQQKNPLLNKEWALKNPDKNYASHRKYIEHNKEKYKAHFTVSNALKSGKLIRQSCLKCGSKEVHAHHDDYNKPLSVKWLCPKHHGDTHVDKRKGRFDTP